MTEVETLFTKNLKRAIVAFMKNKHPRSSYAHLNALPLNDILEYECPRVDGPEFQKFTENRGYGIYEFVEKSGGPSQGPYYRWIYKHTSSDGEVKYVKISFDYDPWDGIDEGSREIREMKPVEVTKLKRRHA